MSWRRNSECQKHTNRVLSISQCSRVVRQLTLDDAVQLADGKRADMQEETVLVDGRSVWILLAAEDVADVVAQSMHRQLVSCVGRQYHVDVPRPRVRQPGQTLSAGFYRQVVETVEDHHKLLVVRQTPGDLVQCRLEVLAQSTVRVDLLRVAHSVHLPPR